jgi:hypothetical protein
MSSYTDAMRAVLTNPDSAEPEKAEATASLQRLAEAGNESAIQILTELGLLAAQPSTYTASKAKAVINDPTSTTEQREAAWGKIKTPEDIPAQVQALESELLESLHRRSLADVDYGEVHTFCDERKWTNPAVRLLFFERWLPTYWQTEQGSRKLAELELYELMFINPDKREDSDIAAMKAIAEIRRRLRVDEDFYEMFKNGVATGEISSQVFESVVCDLSAAACKHAGIDPEKMPANI